MANTAACAPLTKTANATARRAYQFFRNRTLAQIWSGAPVSLARLSQVCEANTRRLSGKGKSALRELRGEVGLISESMVQLFGR